MLKGLPTVLSARLSGTRMDAAIALTALLFSLLPGAIRSIEDPLGPVSWALLVIGPAVLLLRRRYPRTVMAVTIVALIGVAHNDLGPTPAVPALVAIGTAMFMGYRAITTGVVVALSVFTLVTNWYAADLRFTAEMAQQSMLVIGWLHVALIAGESMRQRDALIEEAERSKEEAARRRAADERLRIARELHDSLTHSISVIRVQAGVAVHLARKRGEEPPGALVAVEEAAKDATRELRETLTMLREDDGLRSARIGELAERYRGLGFHIEVEVEVDDGLDICSETDHAAYRIVQEALTNAVRHSDGDRVSVRLACADGGLAIEVADNGRAEAPVPGRGIKGMRERVEALGGTIDVGPNADGFAVRASLPAQAVPVP
jgi:signal transduction histidine kinase